MTLTHIDSLRALRLLRLLRVPGPRWRAAFDVALGAILGGYAMAHALNLVGSTSPNDGPAAAVAILVMTVPIIWRRRAPVAVAVALAVGAVLNPVIIGPMVRCGPCLPALLICAFSLGRWAPDLRWRAVAVGIGALFVSSVVQCTTDPQLDISVLVALVPLILALYGTGRFLASRTALVARLRANNEQLRHQREQIAQLAIQADRARIADGLNGSLSGRINDMAIAARSGREALTDPTATDSAERAFEAIGRGGRETLQHMRQMVGTLLETSAPIRPQPTLNDLGQLARQTRAANVRVHVSGEPRVLPAGVELAGYRTVEHLLDAFRPNRSPGIDVYIDFGLDSLQLTVRGPVEAITDQQAALSAAQARVAVHSGTLSSAGLDGPDGTWEATARLPLAAYV
jgi:hypothetical protein